MFSRSYVQSLFTRAAASKLAKAFALAFVASALPALFPLVAGGPVVLSAAVLKPVLFGAVAAGLRAALVVLPVKDVPTVPAAAPTVAPPAGQ